MAGIFHIAEGGLPIPDGKITVDRDVLARLLVHAVDTSDDLLTLPWTSTHAKPARRPVSLLLRPIIVPKAPGFSAERSMEICFVVPGSLVSNLDFVEGTFNNDGGPYLPENDASLAPELWTSHTGRVVLAPYLAKLTKKELGLPLWEDVAEHQCRGGQCQKDENEFYNGGKAFKCMAQDERGIIVTVVVDNYFGYYKKEVKIQIGCSANLSGCVEEEYADGAIAYPRYNPGQELINVHTPESLTLEHVMESSPDRFEVREDGSAVIVEGPTMVLTPGEACYSMRSRTTVQAWPDGGESSIQLLVGNTYVAPGGYRVHAKHRESDATRWHLVGAVPWSTQAYKPAIILGGGKSEISELLLDALVFDEVYIGDVDEDFGTVQRILDGNYADRFVDPVSKSEHHRLILSECHPLGSMIKLLMPSSMYTGGYDTSLESIPGRIKELIFVVKRLYQPNWRKD